MLFLRRTAILKKELQYERTQGPTLRLLAELSKHSSIFSATQSVADISANCRLHDFDRITVKEDCSSNLRALYFAVLLLAQWQNCQDEGELPLRLKECIYAEPLQLPEHSSAMSSCLVFSSQEAAKKVLAELIQTLLHGSESICELFNRVSCLDELLIAVIRSVYARVQRNSKAADCDALLPTSALFYSICRELAIDLQQPRCESEWQLDNQLTIRQTGINSFEIVNQVANSELPKFSQSVILCSQIIESPKNHRSSQPSLQQFVRLSGMLDPRTAISEESSNSVRSENEFSDIIEREDSQRSSSPSPLSGTFGMDSENFDSSNSRNARQPSIDLFQPLSFEEDFIKDGFKKDKPCGSQEPLVTLQSTNSSEAPFNIFDGMTGEDVIRIMSPKHVRNLNERKKQSMMSVMSGSKRNETQVLRVEKDSHSHCQEDPQPSTINSRIIIDERISRQQPPSVLRNNTSSAVNIERWRSFADRANANKNPSEGQQSGMRTSSYASQNSPRVSSPNISPSPSVMSILPQKRRHVSTVPVCFTYHISPTHSFRRLFGEPNTRNSSTRIQFATIVKPITQAIRRAEGPPSWRPKHSLNR